MVYRMRERREMGHGSMLKEVVKRGLGEEKKGNGGGNV